MVFPIEQDIQDGNNSFKSKKQVEDNGNQQKLDGKSCLDGQFSLIIYVGLLFHTL